MSVHLLSFAAGIQDSQFLIERFKKQASSCKFFDQTVVVAEGEDQLFDTFYEEFSDFVNQNPRGYGYWLWKPFIIFHYMKRLSPGDILVYCDIGCELSSAGAKKFSGYEKILDNLDFLTFSTFNRQPESYWCKKELLDEFKLSGCLIQEEQVAATFFMLKVSDFSINLVNEWLDLAKSENFIYINDHCTIDQLPEFIEHRHDQAIFSMLIKKYDLPRLRERSYFPPLLYYNNSYVYKYPFHALRSKTKEYFIEPNSLFNYRAGFYQFFKYHLIFLFQRVDRKIKLLLGLI